MSGSHVETIARLIGELEHERVAVGAPAAEQLARLLPNLTEAEAARLAPEQRAALTESLRFGADHAWPTSHDVPFVVAVLRASPAFGDDATIAAVEAIAAGHGQPEVVEAAQLVASELRQRVDARKHSDRLLRSSDSTAWAEKTMVRPAPPAGDGKA